MACLDVTYSRQEGFKASFTRLQDLCVSYETRTNGLVIIVGSITDSLNAEYSRTGGSIEFSCSEICSFREQSGIIVLATVEGDILTSTNQEILTIFSL